MSKGLINKMVKTNAEQLSFLDEIDRQLNEKLDKKKKETLQYISAGNATFTIESTKLNKRYTYKVVHKKIDKCKYRYIVSVLYGNDNESAYRYVGIYYSDTGSFKTAGDNKPLHDKIFAAFIRMLHSDTEPWYDTCKLYKSVKCAHCGRKLTTPESIERGIGPECYEKVKGV